MRSDELLDQLDPPSPGTVALWKQQEMQQLQVDDLVNGQAADSLRLAERARDLLKARALGPDELAKLKAGLAIQWGRAFPDLWHVYCEPHLRRPKPPTANGASLREQVVNYLDWQNESGLPESHLGILSDVADDRPVEVVPFLAWEGRTTCLHAKAKAGKTSLVGAAAAKVTTGDEFLGEKCQQGRVLWVRPTASEGGQLSTVKAITLRHGGDPAQVVPMGRVGWHGDPLGEITTAIAYFCPRLVVIDTLAALSYQLGAEKGDAKSWGPIFHVLSEAIEGTHTGLVFIHHANVSGTPRDSSAISAGVDMIAHLEATEIHRRTLTYEGRARVPKLALAVSLGPDGYPTTYEVATADGMTSTPDIGGGHDLDTRLLYLFDQEPRSQAKAYSVVGGNKGAFNTSFQNLRDTGQVTPTTPQGHNWQLTESGIATMNRALGRAK